MKLTTLCYIEKDGAWLMLHRTKKKVDCNAGKWIGVGGKVEEGESPDDCLVREVREETGLELESYRLRGIVTFVSDEWETEQMFLYTAIPSEGEPTACDEGELKYVPIREVFDLNLWEGDRVFLRMLVEDAPFFMMKLVYEGEELVRVAVDGEIVTGDS